MNPRKIAVLFLALVFPAMAFASEPGQSEPEGEPSSVNVLGETEERSQEVTVRAMTLREILLQRLRERHAAGLDTDIPESFIENLPDEAIEEIFQQADEEEDFDLDVLVEDEGEDEQEDTIDAEEASSLLDFLRENKGILAATAAGAAAFAAVGYGFAKEDEDFDYDGDEDEDDYEDTETASTAPDDSFFSLGGVAEAGALYGGGGWDIDTDEPISTANEAWSYNNCRDRVRYIDTGDQVADVANYMSDLSREAFGKKVPTWFWKTIIRCEVNKGDVLGAHFNNPGGMDYDGWMDRYCVGPVVPTTFVDDGGETHVGAKFFSIQDGIICQVAWFCRPDADSWWAEEINAAANASTLEEAEHAIRLHVAQYNRGMELSDYNADPELEDNHFKNPDVPYYEVFKEEYQLYIEQLTAQNS